MFAFGRKPLAFPPCRKLVQLRKVFLYKIFREYWFVFFYSFELTILSMILFKSRKSRLHFFCSILFFVFVSSIYYDIYIYAYNPLLLLLINILFWGIFVSTYKIFGFMFFNIMLFCFSIFKLVLILSPSLYYKIQLYLC